MMLLGEDEGKTAVCLARKTIEKEIAGKVLRCPDLTAIFEEKRGVFVTLNKCGELRGCIGYPHPVLPLSSAIQDAALSAAMRDPRFIPVKPEEIEEISIEVTVLTPPEPLLCPAAKRAENIQIGRHGLIIQGKGHTGLLLPQVATEYGWSPEEFLNHTCNKAGLFKGCWKDEEFDLLTFEGQIFSEKRKL